MLTRRLNEARACLQNTSVHYWENTSRIYVLIILRIQWIKTTIHKKTEKLTSKIFSKLLEIIIPYFANMKQLLVKHHRSSRVLVSRRGFARTSMCLGRRMTYLPRVAYVYRMSRRFRSTKCEVRNTHEGYTREPGIALWNLSKPGRRKPTKLKRRIEIAESPRDRDAYKGIGDVDGSRRVSVREALGDALSLPQVDPRATFRSIDDVAPLIFRYGGVFCEIFYNRVAVRHIDCAPANLHD